MMITIFSIFMIIVSVYGHTTDWLHVSTGWAESWSITSVTVHWHDDHKDREDRLIHLHHYYYLHITI